MQLHLNGMLRLFLLAPNTTTLQGCIRTCYAMELASYARIYVIGCSPNCTGVHVGIYLNLLLSHY